MLRVLSVFCDSTLAFLAASPEAYVQNPNLVEDFYDLCGRTLQSIPEVLFGAGDMVLRMTQAALPGVQLQHREANNSVMRFLESLAGYGHEVQPEEGELAVNVPSYREAVLRVLEACGQALVDQLVGFVLDFHADGGADGRSARESATRLQRVGGVCAVQPL